MRTFQQFLEATESDVRAMGGTDSQIAALKKRQEKRGYGFQGNDDRNPSAPKKTQSPGLIGTREKVTPNTKPKPEWDKGKTGTGYPKAKNTGALATTPKPKSRALTTTPKPKSSALTKREPNSLAKTPADKGADIVRTQKRPPSAQNTTDKPAQGGALARRSPSSPEGPDNTYADRRKERLDRETADKTAKRDQTTRSLSNAANTGLKYANKALKLGRKSVTKGPGATGPDSVKGSSEIIRGSRS